MRTTHYISGSNAYVTLFSSQFLEERLFHYMRLLSKCKIKHADELHCSLRGGLRLRWKHFHFERVCRWCRHAHKPSYHDHTDIRFLNGLQVHHHRTLAMLQQTQLRGLSRTPSQIRKLSNDGFSTRRVQNADSCMICTNESRSS